MSRSSGARAAVVALGLALGCGGSPEPSDAISIGLLLSYSGQLAANATNSERGLLMAVDSANTAGGISGRHLRVLARDTQTNPTIVAPLAHELLDAGAALFIGPDTIELAVAVLPVLRSQALIMPSFATTYAPYLKPNWWFVMGASRELIACELVAQLHAEGREKTAVLVEPGGYSGVLAAQLSNAYGQSELFLPRDQPSNPNTVQPILSAPVDSYVLATFPAAGSSLVTALTAVGALADPKRWYLSPTLHTPAFLENIPRGALEGARGVAPGTGAGAEDFRARFEARWKDTPLDDAYTYYDAGAIAVLAIQRAMAREGSIPAGAGLASHVVAVTQKTATPVRWNEIDRGLALLRQGQEVSYVGVSSVIEFDIFGLTAAATTKWWVIQGNAFVDVPAASSCH
jgi:ABC-type branched-subunit amino acid transport system substrate-binding protein